MLERYRHRLSMLKGGSEAEQRERIEARRSVVIVEYLAEYRKLCRDVGPYAYAADLGLPAGLDGPIDFRLTAYAVAHHDMAADCDFLDEAIEAAFQGFTDWQAAEETATG